MACCPVTLLPRISGYEKLAAENIYILECTLDDMNPEWFTYLRKRLEDAGLWKYSAASTDEKIVLGLSCAF